MSDIYIDHNNYLGHMLFQKFIDDSVLYNILMLYNWYFMVNQHMSSSLEASTSIKAPSLLASYSSLSVI